MKFALSIKTRLALYSATILTSSTFPVRVTPNLDWLQDRENGKGILPFQTRYGASIDEGIIFPE